MLGYTNIGEPALLVAVMLTGSVARREEDHCHPQLLADSGRILLVMKLMLMSTRKSSLMLMVS